MSGSGLSLLEKLTHPDERVFETALAEVGFLPLFTEDPAQLFSGICQAISDCETLGSIERQRRVGLILNVAHVDREFYARLAADAHAWQPAVKNAVVRFLPPEHKSRVYGHGRLNATSTDIHEQQARAAATTEDSLLVAIGPDVLLLGALNEQQSNAKFLGERGFRPLRVKTPEEFQNLIRNDVCGVVIGNSWWSILLPEEHANFAEQVFGYSSFAWIKVDYSSCGCRADLGDVAKRLRFRDANTHELVLGQTSQVTDVDVLSLRRAWQAIQNEASVRLCPADIQPSQAQVLIAGVCEHVKLRNPRTVVAFEEIATTTIDGGLSSALVVRAEPNDGGPPFIAKLAPISQLRDEMARFDCFIRPWDDQLRPCFHYHNGIGAIIFGLVGTPDNRTVAAPTLDATLHRSLLVETGAPACDQPSDGDLFTLIGRTVDRLRALNERPCTNRDFRSLAWTDVGPLKALADRGVAWHFPRLSAPFDLLSLCNDAIMLANEIGMRATVHGDIHLRNVLVRDGREPSLIDYAYAGPGHPCYDLVRLEAAVLFQAFRMTDDEAAITELLRTAREPSATLESLSRRFPHLCASLGNRLAIHTFLLCRRACENLLAHYQAPNKHFAAMQFLIACQSLSNQRFQTGIVRAAAVAAGEAFATNPNSGS